MISLQCVDLLSFDFGAIWLQQIQFGTISFQWVCFHLIWSDLATVGIFQFGTDGFATVDLLSFDLKAILATADSVWDDFAGMQFWGDFAVEEFAFI